MKQARYPFRGLIADYARSLAGIVCLAFPMIFADLPTYLTLFFWAVVAIFLFYGARTLNRQLTVFEYDDKAITARGGIAAGLQWQDLELLNLRYFSTRRDRQEGWMHLQLVGGGRKLRLDSNLDGFREIATLAYHRAAANGLVLNPHSAANFSSMGLGEAAGGAEEERPGS